MNRSVSAAAGLWFLAALAVHLWAASVGWSHSIMDVDGFRQSHTAISTYWLLHGGRWLAYETPVLGPPWSIPLEFPLYEWVVAVTAQLLSLPLNQAGRLVSLLFFYASLPPAYALLGCLNIRPAHRWLVLGLWLVSPMYLFWSRTFMIESTALCLSLWFLAAIAVWLDAPRRSLLAVAAVCGMLAAAVKPMTIAAFMLAAVVPAVRARRRGVLASDRLLAAGTVAVLLPVAAAALWTWFADAQKAQNPLAAAFLLVSQLTTWNFGTPAMRLDPLFWQVLLQRTVPEAIGHWGLLPGAVMGLLLAGRRGREAALCAGLFLSAPLVFANLHFVHNYYPYANDVFLVAFVGVAVVALLERPGWRAGAGAVLLLAAGAAEVTAYARGYYLDQRETYSVPVADIVRQVTEPSDVVLIYGLDWSSVIPYHAERRALADRGARSLSDPIMQAALAQLQGYRVGAAVFCRSTVGRRDLIEEVRSAFDLQMAPLPLVPLGGGESCAVYRAASRGASG